MTKFSTPLCSMTVMQSRFSNTGHCQLFFARVARFSRVFLGSRNYKFSIRLLLCSTIYCLHNVFFVACLVYKKLHRFGSFLKSPLFWRERQSYISQVLGNLQTCVLSRILTGCPGPSRPMARFWACPIIPLSRDNEETSVFLSCGTRKSRPVGNPSWNA